MESQLLWRTASGRNDKNIKVAAAVAGKSDPLSIGRKARINVARFVDRETLDVLAVLVGGPNVAKIAESDAPGVVMRITHQPGFAAKRERSEEHTSELQSRPHLVCRL